MKSLSYADAIKRIARHVREHRTGPAETVEALWPTLKTALSEEARDELMQQGLRDRATDLMHTGRYIGVSSGGVTSAKIEVHVTDHGTKTIFLDLFYTTGGGVKPFGEFTEDDCYSVATTMKQDALGKMRVAEFMEETANYLKGCKVKIVNSLPSVVRRELRKKWPMQ